MYNYQIGDKIMKMSDFLVKAEQYIKSISIGKEFKLKDILGKDCPAYPGTWLADEVRSGRFNTSEYIIECIGIDYSDTYIKRAL